MFLSLLAIMGIYKQKMHYAIRTPNPNVLSIMEIAMHTTVMNQLIKDDGSLHSIVTFSQPLTCFPA